MIVFIAVPSSGVVIDGQLSKKFLEHMATLRQKYPNYTFVSPMIQDYALLPYMEVEATWDNWGQHCRRLILVSDQVWVLQYDGWHASVGVTAEIRHAREHCKPVYFFDLLWI